MPKEPGEPMSPENREDADGENSIKKEYFERDLKKMLNETGESKEIFMQKIKEKAQKGEQI
ncbi:MAG: hypothetical protein AAB509_01750 [Patescibacteria group bacterium]